MAELVSEIMERDPVTVTPETSVEDVVAAMREHGLPGLPVVDSEGTVWGIVTEADLVLPDQDGDLHIPHYINLFGGTVFLEPLSRFGDRLRKAFAANAADMMTRDVDSVRPDTTRARGRSPDPRAAATTAFRWSRTASSSGWSPASTCSVRSFRDVRAVADIDLGAIERNCARLPHAAVRGGEGERVRARHRSGGRGRARGRRGVARGGHRGRGGRAAGGRDRRAGCS